ncbi:MAG: dienelactone hydrolase family protein [Myxococcales bacterium]|nr:dienelactone hydrolase family protein [Myxococcales bacterium]
MSDELLRYSEGGQDFDAFIARPSGPGPHPAVLICHAWAGRDAFAENKARALAELGYVGAAIDVYGVGRRGHDTASNQALMMPLIADPPTLRRRLGAAFEAVSGVAGVDRARIGSIGFCFGGLCSLLTARMGLPLVGVVSFHGLLKIGEKLEHKARARILVLHGQDDPMVPPADVGAFAEEMKRIDANWALEAYAGVKHAFTNPEARDPHLGMAYDAGADARSWLAMRRFFSDVFASHPVDDESSTNTH